MQDISKNGLTIGPSCLLCSSTSLQVLRLTWRLSHVAPEFSISLENLNSRYAAIPGHMFLCGHLK